MRIVGTPQRKFWPEFIINRVLSKALSSRGRPPWTPPAHYILYLLYRQSSCRGFGKAFSKAFGKAFGRAFENRQIPSPFHFMNQHCLFLFKSIRCAPPDDRQGPGCATEITVIALSDLLSNEFSMGFPCTEWRSKILGGCMMQGQRCILCRVRAPDCLAMENVKDMESKNILSYDSDNYCK